jgi:ligand-binding sensor domain-containing protein
VKDVIGIEAAKNGKVLFSSFKGLLILENDKWNLMTPQNSKLPSEHVSYANYDSKDRLWIGTYAGTVMMGKDGTTTEFNTKPSPLMNLCITDMTEDKDGTLWFATYDYSKKVGEKLVKLDPNGNWSYFDISDSGLPYNHINKVLIDRYEDVLWLSVHNVGLVRFDKKDGWEVYNHQNSGVPSVYIFDMKQDSKGNIWGATFSGLLRVSKKNTN